MNSSNTNPARSRQLPEERFAPALEQQAQPFFDAISAVKLESESGYVERSLYSVSHEAQLLEDYLDRHGANHNKRFHLIREDVSGIRWVAKALSCLSLLKEGPNSYPAADITWNNERLASHVEISAHCLAEYLENLTAQFNSSWLAAGLPLVDPKVTEVLVHPPVPVLPSDLINEEDAKEDDNPRAALYLSRYLRLFNSWKSEATQRISSDSDWPSFMQKYCTEAIARSFESRVHNLQSDYDSHIRNSKQELACPQLRKIRGAVSQCLHLLESVTAITHLYERHRHQRQLSAVLPWKALVTLLVNHLIYPAYKSLKVAAPLAQELLAEISIVGCVQVKLPDGVDMHARPLSLIANIVKHHGLDVEIECAQDRANAASFMAMLVVIGSNPDERTYSFYGDNAVISDIKQLFELGLGENGLDKVTDAFPYLK